ncbi:MAG: alternative ribosome rescue aminoacyl-tRNA hydrolase ArfB [Ardenticatenaceae bacterium]
MDEGIRVAPGVEVPLGELRFSFARAGGPGGQHVNRAETKVELRWDVAGSSSLDETQRALLRERLASYITDEGVLLLSSGETRSQHRNRERLLARFETLVRNALRPRRVRRPTKPSSAARARRLERKRRHSAKKRERRIDRSEY